MKRMKYLLLLSVLMIMSCAETGVVNVELNKGYSEFTIQSKHDIVKEVALELSGEASCEVKLLVSKREVEIVGTGTIDWKKKYPWRAGEFRVKLYSPECSNDGVLQVKYAFKK
ncbi:MAG: hypothetical protein HKN68_07095 [Saprospiraceae bacterium]|nr:hypothetical protein [Saprospiraceae bacterium]